MSDLKKRIPEIYDIDDLETKVNEFKPYYERNFTKRYCTESSDDQYLDTCLSLHNSRICLLFLAKGHSIIEEQKRIKSLNFHIGNEDRLKNSVSGKYKRHAQNLEKNSVICNIETTDGMKYPVCSGIAAKLLDINEVILKDSQKIVENFNTTGYIAMLHPLNFRSDPENILKDLMKIEDYEKVLATRDLNKT